jgi:uncharacterized protein (TIGR02246 family)
MRTLLSIVAAVALSITATPGQDDDPAAAELAALETSAKSFVEAFNKGDAAAIAALFVPNGEMVLASGELIAGRAAIEAHYADVFAADQATKAALEAGAVRFITPSVAIEDGTVHLTAASGAVSSADYVAVQVKQADGSWQLASVRDEAGDRAPANEKMLELAWLVGGWIAEVKGTDTRITFVWSDAGPFIDGKATTEEAGVGSTAATWRIGWDPRRKDFVSWGFDDGGGYNFSEWTTAADGSWLLHTRGVTADGENNRLTQVITAGPGHESFTVARRDQVIDDEVQPDRTVTFVKQPPEPKAAAVNPK